MNEEYLWHKTGDDAEIRQLENLLKDFRHSDISAPKLPSIEVPMVNKSRRKAFQYFIAAAACVAFAIVSIGFWFNSGVQKKVEIVGGKARDENVSKPEVTQISDSSLGISDVPILNESNIRTIPAKLVSFRKNEPVRNRPKNQTAEVRLKKEQMPKEIELTADERFAYEQLKLALSITGTQLKIVKDKVGGDIEVKKLDSK